MILEGNPHMSRPCRGPRAAASWQQSICSARAARVCWCKCTACTTTTTCLIGGAFSAAQPVHMHQDTRGARARKSANLVSANTGVWEMNAPVTRALALQSKSVNSYPALIRCFSGLPSPGGSSPEERFISQTPARFPRPFF